MPQLTDDYFEKLAGTVQKRLDSSTKRLSTKLGQSGVLQSGDAKDVSEADWHEMIKTNWYDPAWRAQQAGRIGPVKLVQDALKAYGLSPSLLKQNASAVTLGVPPAVDATEQFQEANPPPPTQVAQPESAPTGPT